MGASVHPKLDTSIPYSTDPSLRGFFTIWSTVRQPAHVAPAFLQDLNLFVGCLAKNTNILPSGGLMVIYHGVWMEKTPLTHPRKYFCFIRDSRHKIT